MWRKRWPPQVGAGLKVEGSEVQTISRCGEFGGGGIRISVFILARADESASVLQRTSPRQTTSNHMPFV
jgi:hypothetical protein